MCFGFLSCAVLLGFVFFFFFSFVVCWDLLLGVSVHAPILTLAEIPLLTCRAVLSQHQCRGDSRQTFPGGDSWSFTGRAVMWGVKDEGGTHRRKLGEEYAQDVPGPGVGSLGREDQGVLIMSVVCVL